MSQEKPYVEPDDIDSRRLVFHKDDSIITIKQLLREVAILKERSDRADEALQGRLELCVSSIEHKLTAMQSEIDKTLAVFAEARERFQQRYDEKFQAVHMRFDERERREEMQLAAVSKLANNSCSSVSESLQKFRDDMRVQVEELTRARVQQRIDLTDLINTSVAHLRESFNDQTRANSLAVSKNEAAVAKQFDQITTLLNTSVSALNDKIDDLKGRILVIEGSGKGSKELSGVLLTMVGLVIAAIAAGIAFMRIG